MHIHNKVLSACQWDPFCILSKLEEVETRGPLSPYLFDLAMEVLSCLLERAREGAYFLGFRVRRRWGEELDVSHLLFVGDALVFSKDS